VSRSHSTLNSAMRTAAIASLGMAVASVLAQVIYLTNNLSNAFGAFTYTVADVLYGPVWSLCLLVTMSALRGRLEPGAAYVERAAWIAAAFAVLTACVRASNRGYHLLHPELRLEADTTVLTVWATLVGGLIGAGWHALGWSRILLGWRALSTRQLPRPFGVLCIASGVASLGVFLQPVAEAPAFGLELLVNLALAVVLWRERPMASA
jgi:hypothetical protein